MRLAFIDLQFAWPPPGGAQFDVVNTMTELQRMGHDVYLFCVRDTRQWRFSGVDEATFPLPVTQLDFDETTYNADTVATRFREAVDAWQPDVVFLCFMFWFRPYVARALAHYPLIDRFYTYENLCIKDFALYKRHTTCPNDFVNTPNACRRCFVWSWRHGMVNDRLSPFAWELLAVDGLGKQLHADWVQHLRDVDAVIVYNEMAKERLRTVTDRVHVIPGGVHFDEIPYEPVPMKGRDEKKIILMSGRADDPLKGIDTLLYAADILHDHRNDFEVWVTHTDPTKHEPHRTWLKSIGWRPRADVIDLYRQSDICVVPSDWDEPFGMVAVEAMAAGRPTVVSRVGGLQHIPIHDETGLIFDRRNHRDLAVYLNQLLDDPARRRTLGEAARTAARAYDWSAVVARHYPPLLEAVTQQHSARHSSWSSYSSSNM